MAEENAAPPAEAPAGEAPAEGAPAEGGEAAPAPNKKKKLLLIISGAVAVVGIAVAVGVVFFLGGSKEGGGHEAAATAVPDVAIFDVPELSFNLMSDEASGQRFVKARLAVELANPKDVPAVEKLLPRLQDDWGGFLRQMRVSDLQGSANLQRFKEALLRRANQSLEPVAVKAVYVREILVQ